MEYGKSELKALLANSPREGWNEQKINALVDTLWREKYPGADEVIYGGVTWNSGLSFTGSVAKYRIENKLYTARQTNFSIDAADATHPRIDLVTLNTAKQWQIIKGTAAATPLKPTYNRNTNIEVTYIHIPAAATEPSAIEEAWADKYLTGATWNEATGILTLLRSGGLPAITVEISGTGGSGTDEKVKYDAGDTAAGYLSAKIVAGTGITITEGTGADENKLKVSVTPDNTIKVAIDFVDADALEFVYNCPVALKFTSQESEGADATISPALNTNMAQYGKVTINAAEVGLIVLNGETL